MNEKTVWVVLKGSVADLPPVMSLLQFLLEKSNYKVAFISTVKSQLKGADGKFTEYIKSTPTSENLLLKAWQYLSFRYFAIRTLEQHANASDMVWYASLDTALAMRGSSIFQRFTYILQLHELYDTHPHRLKLITPVARRAQRVVVPEINRAGVLQVWLGLRERPTIMPNKPYSHPRKRLMEPTSELTRNILLKYKTNKPVILYQGHIGGDRNLIPLAEAMKLLPDFELWLMGKDHGFASILMRASENIKYLGYLPPPLHLEITSHASIGVINYDAINLNNLFCAPNKIWEYAGFGIPFISNDLPSLEALASLGKFGIATSFESNLLVAGIRSISTNLTSYGRSAHLFYDSINTEEIILDAIKGGAL